MSPEKPIRGQREFTKDTAPIAVSLRDITDNKARGRLRAASVVDAIKTSLTRWVDSDGWTYKFENLPRVTISEKDIKRAASTVDLKVWDASNTLIFRDRIHAWDGFPVLVPDGTQRQETLTTGEINLVDNFKEDPLEAVKTDLAHTVRVVTKTGTVPWVKAKPGTVSTFYADTGDGYVYSNSTSYASTRSGSNLSASTDVFAREARWAKSGSDYYIFEGFFRFDTSAIGVSEEITSAELALHGTGISIQNADGWTNILARLYDYGAGLDTGDYRATDGTSSGDTLLASLPRTSWSTSAYNTFSSESEFASSVTKGGWTGLYVLIQEAEAATAPTGTNQVVWYSADESGTSKDPKLVVTHAPPNTAPTITAGPTTTYASGTCTTPTVTWGVTFTATDSEQTGADALTYYIRTSSTFGAGTQVATGTCTSGASKVVTGLAYNASGVVEGTQTLYLHIYDGALNTVTASSFTLVRRFIKSAAGTSGALTGSLVRRAGKSLSGISGSVSGTLSRITNKALTGVSGALSGSLVADFIAGGIEYLQSVSGAIGTLTGSLAKATNKSLSGVMSTATGEIARIVNKALSGSPASLSASLSRVTMKSFSGVSGILSGTLSANKTTVLALAGAISTISGTLATGAVYAKAIAGELLSLTGNVSRMTLKALSGASGAVSGALSSTRLFSKAVAGEIAAVSGSVTRFVTKSFFGTITGSGILSTAASFYRTVTGSLSSLSGAFSFRIIIRRAKIKGGSVVRSVISGGSRRLR